MIGWMATKTINSGTRMVSRMLRRASTMASSSAQTKAGRPLIGR